MVRKYKFRPNSDLCLTGDFRQMLPGVIVYGILVDLNLYVRNSRMFRQVAHPVLSPVRPSSPDLPRCTPYRRQMGSVRRALRASVVHRMTGVVLSACWPTRTGWAPARSMRWPSPWRTAGGCPSGRSRQCSWYLPLSLVPETPSIRALSRYSSWLNSLAAFFRLGVARLVAPCLCLMLGIIIPVQKIIQEPYSASYHPSA